jgi:hypothetical protein
MLVTYENWIKWFDQLLLYAIERRTLMFLARETDGSLWLFENKPKKITGGYWISKGSGMILNKDILPCLINEDEPFEVELKGL